MSLVPICLCTVPIKFGIVNGNQLANKAKIFCNHFCYIHFMSIQLLSPEYWLCKKCSEFQFTFDCNDLKQTQNLLDPR